MKIDIISGFLGAGKTTIIKKMILEVFSKEKIAIIENEFGEVSIDGLLLKDSNINIREINSGCICCSMVGDFKLAIKEIINKYNPDRILIEPSGVAKLSDIIKSCKEIEEISINNIITIIDVLNYNVYLQNFGEFYINQIKYAKTIIASNRENMNKNFMDEIVNSIKTINNNCNIITSSLELINTYNILNMSQKQDDNIEISRKFNIKNVKHFKKVKKHKNYNITSNIFKSWGIETLKCYSKLKLEKIFKSIEKSEKYGLIIRSKGIVKSQEGKWLEFHYTLGKFKIKNIDNQRIGRIVIIGQNINKEELESLF
ncbi:GTP-binding protein [Clostridium weizhouense]|uniref:GTP-binding protein n=1 Tax=Clostridium weizhouense TaxID=2859781 RepID=A0ABS7API8_9CLOT|nr:GTP-binding protein [Clostridium weizhouense]MBW6409621.1 GTP-binding protein [Clostridium weizhouense]